MRLVLAAIVLWAASLGPQASALTTCPTSEYTIAFKPNDDRLDADDEEIIAAAVARTRQCSILRFELVVEGDFALAGSLAQRRTAAVRNAHIAQGLSPEVIHTANVSSERYGQSLTPQADTVSVIIYFR